ncbi:branched-chain amino acid ABC transporter permease [Muricoccus radiodurans]|uniref:branched-chain amino acid ABC transporter permease n=1 Tax=Muricoccus radiodurans TaxID=2231721 RepID=UPI003CED64E7
MLQALLNGVVSGTLLALPAVGFSAIFAVLRYTNFAIGGFATLGAYAAWGVNTSLGLPLAPSLVAAFLAGGIVAVAVEWGAVRGAAGGGPLRMAIASLAAGIVLENVARFVWGNDPQGFDLPFVRDMVVGPVRVGPGQLQALGLALGLMLVALAILRLTRLGRAMRAVADNPELARLRGVEPGRIAALAVFVGGAFAGVGGTLAASDTLLDPLAGTRLLLPVFAAAVLGGLGSLPGAVVGAILLGIAEEMTSAFLSPAYRQAVGFLAILLVLTLRPGGLLAGRALRAA